MEHDARSDELVFRVSIADWANAPTAIVEAVKGPGSVSHKLLALSYLSDLLEKQTMRENAQVAKT